MRTYAIFSPASPRSTLKTLPDAGPRASPAVAGSSERTPSISSGTPAPVIADPENTGCTAARAVCAASSPRRRDGVTAPSR